LSCNKPKLGFTLISIVVFTLSCGHHLPIFLSFFFVTVGETFLIDGKQLLLKADNGKYLSRINSGPGYDPIEPLKTTPDVYCHFTVHSQPDGAVVLQADNGKYLSRMNRGPNFNPIEASKVTPDVFFRFKVYNQFDGSVVLQADNGKYLSRVRRGSRDHIEAYKDNVDVFCKFRFRQFHEK